MSVVLNHPVNGMSATTVDPDYVVFPSTQSIEINSVDDSVSIGDPNGDIADVTAANALKVDGSAVTQPVSVTSLPLPSGAATAAKQDTGNTSLASIDGHVDVALSTRLKPADTLTAVATLGTITNVVHVDDNSSSLTVDGAVTANAGTNLNTSLLALDSTVAKDSSLSTINTSINTLLKPANTLAAVTTVGTITNVVHVDDNSGSLTVDGTIAATQSGTWNINNVSGTVSLPTGAATETTLGSVLTELQQKTEPTDTQNTVGIERSATLTVTNTDSSSLTIDCSGMNTVSLHISGTWNGNLQFQASQDGSTFHQVYGFDDLFLDGELYGTTTDDLGSGPPKNLKFDCSAWKTFKLLNASSGTTGTSTFYLRASQTQGILTGIAATVGIKGSVRLLNGIDDTIVSTGQTTMTNSFPVTIASNQTAIPITDNSGSLTIDNVYLDTALSTINTSINTLLKPANTLAAVTSITNVVHVDDNSGSLTVDNNGTFAVQASIAAAQTLANVTTLGTVTNVVHVDDNSGSLTVDNAGTFATQATLAAETTKVIGTVNVAAAQTIATTNAGTFAVQATLAAETTKVIGTVNVASAQTIATTNAGTFAVQNKETVATAASLANVASSASNVTLQASNANRRGLNIFNDSLSAVYVKFAATASATSFTVKIPAGGYYEMNTPVYTGIVDGIWDSANGNARVTEIT